MLKGVKVCSYICSMDEFSKENLLTKLRSDIETKSGMRLKHRNDFVAFADLLLQETSLRLSETTLRRFWGYQEGGKHTATVHTLDILCTYLGYKNWDEYESCKADETEPVEPSLDIDDNIAPDAPILSRYRWKWLTACMGGFAVMGGVSFTFLQSRDFTKDGIDYRVESYMGGQVAVASCDKEKKGLLSVPETVSNWGRTYHVTAVDNETFYGCNGLTEVVLPSGVETIGDRAFKCCENLSSIKMEDRVTKMGTETFRTCPRLKDVRLSNSLLELPEYCFSGDSVALVSLVLPDGIRTIGRDAFGKCKELKTIHMPENLETLGRGAFWECRKLEHITLPRSLRSIGKVEFWYCDHLQSITLICPTPPAADSPFEPDRTAPILLRIPKDNVDAYSASAWASLNIEAFEL